MRRRTRKCGNCGRVKIFDMKYHIVLQALSRLQVHTHDLRVYVQIAVTEQGKPGRWRNYLL